MLDKAE